jgi:hypothetical protein
VASCAPPPAPWQDYDAALAISPDSVLALFRRGQVLQALNKRAVSLGARGEGSGARSGGALWQGGQRLVRADAPAAAGAAAQQCMRSRLYVPASSRVASAGALPGLQDAAASLRRAASLADPTTDFALLMDVTTALKALNSMPSSDGGAGPQAAMAAAAAAAGVEALAPLPRAPAEAEDPAVTASRSPHAALALEPTADIAPHPPAAAAAAAAGASQSESEIAAAGSVVGGGGGSAARSSGGGGLKVAKGFFGQPKAKKLAGAGTDSGAGAAPIGGAAGKGPLGRGGISSGDEGDATEIDCAAAQAAARGGGGIAVNGAPVQGATGGGGGGGKDGPVDVAKLLHQSNVINLAVSQVGRVFGQDGLVSWAT